MENRAEILLVEDDPGHAHLIRANLAEVGIEENIRHFADGQLVLDFLFGGAPRDEHYVMLLDVRMPKVDGLVVLERLKGDERLRRMPVIMMSTSDDPRHVDQCYELGCTGYVVKPIAYHEFAATVQCVGCFMRRLCTPALHLVSH